MLMGIMLLPGVVAATNLVDPQIEADCIGYSTDFAVDFHPAVYEVGFSVVVTITDHDGTELFRYEMTDVLVRTGDDPLQTYHFDVLWNDVTDEIIPLFGFMDIRTELRIFFPEDSPFWSPSDYGKFAVKESRLECAVVDNDDLSWSALKADYR
jgi:hypothetical protein